MASTVDPARPIIIVTGANKYVSQFRATCQDSAHDLQRHWLRNLSQVAMQPRTKQPRGCTPTISPLKRHRRGGHCLSMRGADAHHGVSQSAARRGRAHAAAGAVREGRRVNAAEHTKRGRACGRIPQEPRRRDPFARLGVCSEYARICRGGGAHVSFFLSRGVDAWAGMMRL
jgi:hypothetical protein